MRPAGLSISRLTRRGPQHPLQPARGSREVSGPGKTETRSSLHWSKAASTCYTRLLERRRTSLPSPCTLRLFRPISDYSATKVRLAPPHATLTLTTSHDLPFHRLIDATFLAERYAAAFPNSENAVYLLAYCYYRSGSPKSARSVLLSRWLSRNNVSSVLKSADVDLERTRSSARYLLAKCCVELGYYGEAEEVLVRHAREKFSRVVDKNAGIVNGVKINGNWSEAMDAWIIQEARPCPIPNGAAGLNLLGLICRKTNRNQRSIEYHRMALKLDPLMWTSYEAICELSGPVGSSTEADDPNSIFGVPAPVLSPRNEENALGAQHNFFRAGKSRTTRASLGGGAPSAFMKNRYGTPSTPYSSFGNMDLTSGLTTTAPNESGVNFHLPATASTKADRTKAGTSTFPANNLFDAPSNATKTPAPTNLEKPPTSAAVGYADQVLDRARRVVAGLAYDPSPEQKSRPGDNGKDLTFSRTPASASGLTSGATTAPFSVGVSTVKGEKRSLFASNMKSSPKKSPKKEESKVDEDEHQPLNLSTTVRTIEDKQVEKIMQLLCGVGAAYKSLCQFKSDDALELFRELPREQQQTGWVQHQIGKAYFEMSDYQNAERALKLMQKVEPHRMKGLDILSTTLWQVWGVSYWFHLLLNNSHFSICVSSSAEKRGGAIR